MLGLPGLATALATAAALVAAPAAAGERADDGRASALRHTDPCTFYRSQAWQKGLDHFAQDMLWSCEVINRRRSVGMPLSDRLRAAEAALDVYRAEVVRRARLRFREDRARGADPFHRRITDDEKRRIAAETGALKALAALSTGY
jgi:hypothetical protein